MPDLRLRLLLVLDKGIALDKARAAIEGKIQLLDFAMVRKLVISLAAGAMLLSISACNTVRGAGRDLESAANSVDKAT